MFIEYQLCAKLYAVHKIYHSSGLNACVSNREIYTLKP